MRRLGPWAAGLLAIANLLGAAGPARALSVSCSFSSDPSLTAAPGTKKGGIGGGTTVGFSIDTASQVACFDGNDTSSIEPSFALFGHTGWILADKNDDWISGDGKLLFASDPQNSTQSGRFTIANSLGIPDLVVTLKAATGYAAFLLDGFDPRTLKPAWSAAKELSHASVHYRPRLTQPLAPITPTSPVPLPAGLALLGSALAGMAGLRQGRRTLLQILG